MTSLVVFLDTNSVIYLIEQPPTLGSKATARVTTLLAGGERLAVSDLVRITEEPQCGRWLRSTKFQIRNPKRLSDIRGTRRFWARLE